MVPNEYVISRKNIVEEYISQEFILNNIDEIKGILLKK